MPAKNATGIDGQLTGSGVEARELLVHEPLELAGRAAAPARPAALADGSTSGSGDPTTIAPADERGERKQPGEQAEAALAGGRASTPGPNSATSASLISCSVSPAAIRTRMNVFIRSATGAFDWSSVVSQTGQTSSASRSAAFGGAADAPPAATQQRSAPTSERERLTS